MKFKYILLVFVACTLSCQQSITRSSGSQTPEEKDPKPTRSILKNVDSNGTFDFLISTNQLDNRIKQCFPEQVLYIISDAIIGPGRPDAFLRADLFSVGKNIVQHHQADFDGEENSTGSGVRRGSINISYLSALQNVGNHIGLACEKIFTGNMAGADLCRCDTDESVERMFETCMPHVRQTDERLDVVRADFKQKCIDNQKGTIAALASSILFALSP